jgi:hypothetical protein
MSELLKQWGLGAEVQWDSSDAERGMRGTNRLTQNVKLGFERLKAAGAQVAGGLAKITLAVTPLGIAFGFAAKRGSRLASDLEAQKLTMRVLLGDAAKAEDLINRIRLEAAATPFAEGDLIEGSKRLLRLSGDNVDRNVELLGVMETMAALNPTKNITDAVEALLDATSGGGFERLKEFGITMRADDFTAAGKSGGAAWSEAVISEIQRKMEEATRGEDLVGALSRTFAGRVSTAKDAVSNMLREVGIVINERIGPLFEPFTRRMTQLTEDVVPAMEMLADKIEAVVRDQVAPVLARMGAMWDGMGSEGRQNILAMVGAVGALSAAMPLMAAAIGPALLALSGGAQVVGAVGPLLGLGAGGAAAAGAGGAGAAAGVSLSSMLAPLAALVVVLAAIAVAVVTVFGVFKKEGEGPLAFVGRMLVLFHDLWTQIVDVYAPAATHFMTTFRYALGGALVNALNDVEGPLRRLFVKLDELFALMLLGEESARMWRFLGTTMGMSLGWVIEVAARMIGFLINLADVWGTVLGPLMVALREVILGILDLVSGAGSAEAALGRILRGIVGLFAAAIGGIANLLLGSVEQVLLIIAGVIESIPGAKAILGDDGFNGNLGANALGRVRHNISDEITSTILGMDVAQLRAQRAERRQRLDDRRDQPLEVQIDQTTHVEVADREVARATGSAAVRSGERGSGPSLPGAQRGRVLRNGGTVTDLRPAEAMQ